MGNSQFFYIVDPDVLLAHQVLTEHGAVPLSDWVTQLWKPWHITPIEKQSNLRNEIGLAVENELFRWAQDPPYQPTLEHDGLLLISFAESSLGIGRLMDYGLSLELLRHMDGVIHMPEDPASNPGAIIFREGAGFPETIDPRLRIFDFNCWVFLDQAQIAEFTAALRQYQQSLTETDIQKRIAHPDWYWDAQYLNSIQIYQPDLLLYYYQC